MSYSDPDSTVQGSCPHKWGHDVSCGYLMQRWQLILELPIHYTHMAISLHLRFPLGCFGTLWETALGGVPLSPSVISVCREQDCPRQRLLIVWTFFIRPRTFLPPRHGPWAWYEMSWGCQILWPHTIQLKKKKIYNYNNNNSYLLNTRKYFPKHFRNTTKYQIINNFPY